MLLASESTQDGPIVAVAGPDERRISGRLSVLGSADAVLVATDFSKWVQIVDISKGGLAFCYVATKKLLKGTFELDILSENIGLSLEKLKVQIVSDIPIGKELFLGFIPIRRCGAKFTDLTVDQIRELEYFMGANSSGLPGRNSLRMSSSEGRLERRGEHYAGQEMFQYHRK
jgi:hypothetical protein